VTTRQVIYAWQILEFAVFFGVFQIQTEVAFFGIVLGAFFCMISARFISIGLIATMVSLRFSVSDIQPKQFFSLWWGEFWAFCLLYFWYQVLPRKRNRWAKIISDKHVILAHGFLCNDGFWHKLAPMLEENGYSVSSVEMPYPFASIELYTKLLEMEFNRVLDLNRNAQVTFIGFSMGGLAIRNLKPKLQSLANIITIKTPHHGTQLARIPGFFGTKNGVEMTPGSEFITRLNTKGDCFKHAVGIFSAHDTIVIPAQLGTPPFHPLKRKAKGHLHASDDSNLHRHLVRLLKVFYSNGES
jgi:hypothetical protein